MRGLRQVESVTPVPRTPEHVAGVTAVDGAIVPLIDIAGALGERPVAGAPSARPATALLVECEGSTVLIAIDEVVAFEKKSRQTSDEKLDDENLPWTAGSTPILGRPIAILDLPGLLRALRPAC